MVIAIDGPAGAGKSSVAKGVAVALGFTYLDTGAMYRSVALATLRGAASPAEAAARIELSMGERVLLDGEDVTEAIRAPDVTAAASRVARDPAVRTALVARQQELMATGDWVADGRDIALVVAPGAEVKVFLFADPAERARRRAAERGEDPERVRRAMDERDLRDQSEGRTVLEPAPDAVPIDTTSMSIDDVVGQIATLVVEARELR
jgi:cytidylate kinase